MLISNKYFGEFQKAAAQQITNRDIWNEQSWATLQLFNFLNKFMDFQQIDNKINFIQDNVHRKTLGHLRLWIDLQRLYLITFLKLDRITFQQDRIYLSLFRMNKFFFEFLSQYEKSNFSQLFMDELQIKLIFYLVNLKQFVKSDSVELIQQIISSIKNFCDNKPIRDPIKEQKFEKIAYMKLAVEKDIIQTVQNKLNFNVQYKDNLRQINEILRKENIPLGDIEQLYDPTFKLKKQIKESLEEKKQPYDEQKLNSMVEQFRSKQKNIKSPQNVYNNLMRNGHNPYDKNNYTIFGDSVGIDLAKKEKFQKVQVKKSVQTQNKKQEIVYYHPKFMDAMKKINVKSASVTENDLAGNYHVESNRKKMKMSINPKVTNITWIQQDKVANLNTAPTISRNIENNVLFKQDDEQLQHTYKVFAQNILSQRFNSEFLNQLDKELDDIRKKRKEEKQMKFSLKKCEFIENNKFDLLRKVLFYTIAEEKIKILLKKEDFPNYYPRFVDEVIELSYSTIATQQKLFKAIGYAYY